MTTQTLRKFRLAATCEYFRAPLARARKRENCITEPFVNFDICMYLHVCKTLMINRESHLYQALQFNLSYVKHKIKLLKLTGNLKVITSDNR